MKDFTGHLACKLINPKLKQMVQKHFTDTKQNEIQGKGYILYWKQKLLISFMGTGIKQKISATAYCQKTFVRFRVLYLVVTKP